MILSLLLLTQVTLDTLASGMLFGLSALFAIGLWILLEVVWLKNELKALRNDLKKASKL